MIQDKLENARSLLQNANKHQVEFGGLLNDCGVGRIWTIHHELAANGGAIAGRLVLNRATLIKLKPVISDIANNLVHATDHVAAAFGESNGQGRSRDLYYPLSVDDVQFEKNLTKAAKVAGDVFAESVRRIRGSHPANYSHLALLKEISNTNKHWDLTPASSNAAGVQVTYMDWHREILDIPEDYFEGHDQFYFSVPKRDADLRGFEIVIGFRLDGFGAAKIDPQTSFEAASRLVETIIADAERLLSSG